MTPGILRPTSRFYPSAIACATTSHERRKRGDAMASGFRHSVALQRAKEVQDVLFLRRAQRTKVVDHPVRLRLRATTTRRTEQDVSTVRGVCSDGLQEVVSSAVVQEKQPLPHAPKRRCAELVRAGCALRNSIGQPRAHVMYG